MNIDINLLRGLSTIMVMVGFLGVCVWAYSGKRKQEFTEAALLPFAEDDMPVKTSERNSPERSSKYE